MFETSKINWIELTECVIQSFRFIFVFAKQEEKEEQCFQWAGVEPEIYIYESITSWGDKN